MQKPYTHRKPRWGFSLVELLIVIALMMILGLVGYLNLAGRSTTDDVKNTARGMTALLREAQSRSMSQVQATTWGVHFENGSGTVSFYALFYGNYSASTRIGYYRLPVTTQYVTSTLTAGSSTEVIFYQMSGLPSSTLSLNLLSIRGGGANATVTVATSGLISYQ